MEESEYSMGMWDVIALDNALFESIVREMGLQSGITTTYEGKVYDINTAWVIDRSSPMRGGQLQQTPLYDSEVSKQRWQSLVHFPPYDLNSEMVLEKNASCDMPLQVPCFDHSCDQKSSLVLPAWHVGQYFFMSERVLEESFEVENTSEVQVSHAG